MRLKEVKWTLWVKEELGARCRQGAQSERELGRQMRLLLTASTEHLMAKDAGSQPLSSTPLVSHFVAFSRAPLGAFVNMSSHHSYFTVISIVSQVFFFLGGGGDVVFLPVLSKESSLFLLFFCSELENRARHWCLGDWVVFFLEKGFMYSLWCDIQPGRGNIG